MSLNSLANAPSQLGRDSEASAIRDEANAAFGVSAELSGEDANDEADAQPSQIRRYQRGRPDPFRSVRDLGRIPLGCSWKSAESGSRSSVWLPAGLGAWHVGALVAATTSVPAPVRRPRHCPAQTPPSNPIGAGLPGGRVQSRSASRDVHKPPTFTEVVVLRSQPGLTGSGSPIRSYGGFGGGHPHFRPHAACRQLDPFAGPVPCLCDRFRRNQLPEPYGQNGRGIAWSLARK